jgi:quinol monooxygenase YgiN
MIIFRKISVPVLILMALLASHNAAAAQQKDMMVRISEIEINPDYLEEYKAILKEEAEASVRVEPGVISIFPMYQKGNPTQVRILEIYASREAYESHLKTPHFQKYKSTTLKMVRSLRLVDMEAMDGKTMAEIFAKMKNR